MFFNIYITIISAAVVIGCIVAIVMSTSHGTRWLQSLWQGRNAETAARDEDGRPGA